MNNYRRNEMTLYILAETSYVEHENSRAFPFVTRNRLATWIDLLESTDDLSVVRAARQFISASQTRDAIGN